MVNIPCFVHQNGLSVDGLSTLPPRPPDCHPGGQTAYLRGLVHENGLSVDGLSTLPPWPPDCHPGGHTAMRTRLLHPARTLVLSLALATDVGAESSAVFNLNKKTSQVRYNLTRFADFQTYRGVQSCILPPLCLTRYTQGHSAADNHNTFSREKNAPSADRTRAAPK